MRKTIKQLEEELERMEKDKDHWYSQWRELKDKKEKEEQNKIFILEENNKKMASQVQNLLEVIRWHANPETAKYPFEIEKSQREDRRPRY